MGDGDGPRPSGGRRGGPADGGPHLETRRMMARASRRLGILEMVFLLAAVVLALLGGALAAYGLQELGLPFRPTWAVVSLLLFLVPAVLVWRRERRFERERKEARRRASDEADRTGAEWR